MRLAHRGRAAVLALLLAAPAAGSARSIARINPVVALQNAASQADVVVVGTVVAVETEFAQARSAPFTAAGPTVGWTTATVKVSADLLGAAGKTHLRVGWLPNQSYGYSIYNAGGRAMPYYSGVPVNLSEGQDVCLCLTMHPDGDFYVPAFNSAPLVKGQGNYDADLKTVMKVVGVMRDPAAALTAKEAEDRAFAAATLVRKYRTPPQAVEGWAVKFEPVAAAESKLILAALAEMDWNKFDESGINRLQMAFNLLAPSAPDGWTPPQVLGGQDSNAVMSAAVKKWLADHAGTYKMQRYVAETAAPKKR